MDGRSLPWDWKKQGVHSPTVGRWSRNMERLLPSSESAQSNLPPAEACLCQSALSSDIISQVSGSLEETPVGSAQG